MYSQSVPALISKNVGNTLTNYNTWGGIIYNVKAYGAKGDGVTDDAAAIQSAIDAAYSSGGGAVFFPPSTSLNVLSSYRVGSTIKIKSNVYLFAYPGTVILKASASLPSNNAILANSTTSGSVDTYYDSNITIEGIIFDGNNNAGRTAELISIVKAQRVIIEKCSVQNTSFMGIAIGGSFLCKVKNSYFTNTGNPVVTSEGGAAVWVSSAGDGSLSKNINIEDCRFQNLNWSGCYFMPQGGTISNCIFRNCMESSIFTSYLGSRISYINNQIFYATKKNVSASGIECGGSLVRIIGNHIEGCGNSGISLTDTQQIIIESNELIGNGTDPTYTQASGIGVLSTAASPNQPDHISIRNNRIYDPQAVKTQVYGIAVVMSGANIQITNLTIYDNDLGPNKTANIFYQSGVLGGGCYSRGNLGDASNSPKVGQVQAPAATGTFPVTGVGFKPRYIEFQAIDASGSRIAFSTAYVSETSSVGSRIDATNAASPTGGPMGKAVSVIDSTGAVVCEATLSSMNQDGFTLNFTTVTTRAWISYVAHP